MLQTLNSDNLLKCVSGAILMVVVVVTAVETDLLPPPVRNPVRATIRDTGNRLIKLPAVSTILQSFQ